MYSKRKGGNWIEYKSNTEELVRKMTGNDDGGKCCTERRQEEERWIQN